MLHVFLGKGRAKQCGEGTSKSKTSFEKTAGVTYYKLGEVCQIIADKKLMKFKYAWVLYQCAKCEELQKSQARDLFLQKLGRAVDGGNMYVLHFMICSDCRVMNRDFQSLIYKNFNTFTK
ncbi:hypothetical protein Mgra_00009549 [Meloidogyne graminicola]|uniref:Uncharacterized protein n=1 Tax=Meloidogyne graminicola TaxID=189291 RepID=A0A8S9ZB72_9BILA|nr:hypothetical protein Mgra_00009549 [Meloidogyne graminicola]